MLNIILVVVALGTMVLWKLTGGKKYRLPPGPPGLPFFGNIFQLDKDSPQGTITDWADQYGDVMKIKVDARLLIFCYNACIASNKYPVITFLKYSFKCNQFTSPNKRISSFLDEFSHVLFLVGPQDLLAQVVTALLMFQFSNI